MMIPEGKNLTGIPKPNEEVFDTKVTGVHYPGVTAVLRNYEGSLKLKPQVLDRFSLGSEFLFIAGFDIKAFRS